ncbi:MAG: HEAT repeat domain-containing protein [Nitrospinota bacterium]|nr:HEAT repeat domain-containing protein [Nitrospinota bacterium]
MESKDKETINSAIYTIEHGDYEESESMINRMAIYGIEEAIPYILKDKNNPSVSARMKMENLYFIKGPKGYDAIISGLDSQYYDVRIEMTKILGLRNEKKAIENLIRMLEDPYLNIQVQAMRSLKMITGINYGLDKTSWKHWWAKRKYVK